MDFLKKHKKAFLIGAIVLIALIVILIWYNKRSQSSDASDTSKSAAGSSTSNPTRKDLIKSFMDYIKNAADQGWYKEVQRKAPLNSITVDQQLAEDSIHALIDQGKLTSADVGGDVAAYAKANY